MSLPNIKKDTIWITSDTHFDHTNICRGVSRWKSSPDKSFEESTRDFQNLDQMNDFLINSINELVQPDDWLIHLGDWSFGGEKNVPKFRERISCNNILIVLGNHDQHVPKYSSIFSSVHNYFEMDLGDRSKIVLSHYPMMDWNGMGKGSYMIHGHCHLPSYQKISGGRKMDVGVDGNNYKPYLLSDVIDTLTPFSNKRHH